MLAGAIGAIGAIDEVFPRKLEDAEVILDYEGSTTAGPKRFEFMDVGMPGSKGRGMSHQTGESVHLR